MKQLTSSQIRQMYLDFFESKKHDIIPSASLIPVNDPTLLWINAGVAPLKKYFDGSEVPNTPRLANAQKCIRTNDIENVGVTARHHTLFEMLGNWSIGEYFKEEAIAWAWEFLTSEEWLAFDPELLYATYYPEDTDTPSIWKKQPRFIESHLVPIEDNFWDIGAGPCGPDTEIFYDRGEEYLDIPEDDPENFPGGENERYLEIWNLVFSEFNHMPDNTYQPLPHKNVDTGMGLERVTSVMQNTPTNFETDLFMPIIQTIENLSGKKYGVSKETDVSFKLIADHIRAVTFAIGDGALPSNEGRGYILRRLLRRSVMHGQKLGVKEAFLAKLVPVIGNIMGEFYPEVVKNAAFIEKVISAEEAKFHETINGGLELLKEMMAEMDQKGETVVSGHQAFKLYDTFGFPLELTEEYASEHGFSIDKEEFDMAMKEQRDRARAARHQAESMNVQSEVYTSITVDSEFVGYTMDTAKGILNAVVCDNQATDSLQEGDVANVFFTQTPFYAEMGGQVADTGVITTLDGHVVAEVIDVKKAPNGQPMHSVNVIGDMTIGTEYVLVVDVKRRAKVTKNHTATHLLHQALKDVLGTHANQAGSLVAPDYLRFDFSHFGQVTPEELQRMEQIVNEKIWEALEVVTIETTIDKAKEMGAMALFGEKYGENVRVVNAGGWSIELCGGIHVANTSEIGLFKIVSESGIGAGVRRIEAVTSKEAYELLASHEALLKETAGIVKSVQLDTVPERATNLQSEIKDLQHEVAALKAKLMKSETAEVFNNVVTVNGTTLITVDLPNKGMDELRQLADTWKVKKASDILVVATAQGEKANLLVAVDKETVEKGIKAGELIKAIAPKIGGGGGGRPDMAQAGGKKPEGIKEALQEVSNWLENR